MNQLRSIINKRKRELKQNVNEDGLDDKIFFEEKI
jgi:hypothetical protein